jgi:hypothetical protein
LWCDQSTSSAVTPDQTIIIPPQVKIPITQLLPMDLYINMSSLLVFSVEGIPSATLADQSTVQITSPSQRQEIALKQVSYTQSAVFCIIHTYF